MLQVSSVASTNGDASGVSGPAEQALLSRRDLTVQREQRRRSRPGQSAGVQQPKSVKLDVVVGQPDTDAVPPRRDPTGPNPSVSRRFGRAFNERLLLAGTPRGVPTLSRMKVGFTT